MNKKGVTLVELLGATLIFGLVISLLASVFVLITKATESIKIESKANSIGMFVVRTLEEEMLDFDPKDYSTCGPTNCLTLESTFTYSFDENLGDFVLTVHNPIQVLQIEITAYPVLLINGVVYDFDEFVLLNTSSITISESGTNVSIVIKIDLQATNGKIYHFTANHLFKIQPIPT